METIELENIEIEYSKMLKQLDDVRMDCMRPETYKVRPLIRSAIAKIPNSSNKERLETYRQVKDEYDIFISKLMLALRYETLYKIYGLAYKNLLDKQLIGSYAAILSYINDEYSSSVKFRSLRSATSMYFQGSGHLTQWGEDVVNQNELKLSLINAGSMQYNNIMASILLGYIGNRLTDLTDNRFFEKRLEYYVDLAERCGVIGLDDVLKSSSYHYTVGLVGGMLIERLGFGSKHIADIDVYELGTGKNIVSYVADRLSDINITELAIRKLVMIGSSNYRDIEISQAIILQAIKDTCLDSLECS